MVNVYPASVMAKPRKRVGFRIPEYFPPRLAWRRLVLEEARKAVKRARVVYSPSERLQVHVRLYFHDPALDLHDLDNRAKDVLDALQGRLGGSKRARPRNPVIPNDRQIWRLIVEKSAPPKQSHNLGHVTVRLLQTA